ncbi:hypothetical protein [Mycolicibacterium pulveris]|uniref:hypothetical protein n=1 Tax=Mycolicibacterium pulveris TaxID=36813 RepID=UPI003CE7FF9C
MTNATSPAPIRNSSRVTTWRWIAAVLALSQLAALFVTHADLLVTLIMVLSAATMLAVLRFGLGSWWETTLLVDASVVFAGFTVSMLVAAQGWWWVNVAVLAAMVAALMHITRLLVRRSHDLTCQRWLAVLATGTFGLYLGWAGIAVFANVAAALIDSGAPATVVWWQLVVLVAAAGFAIGLARMLRGTPGYVVGVLWALAAIAVGAAQRGSSVLTTTAVAAGLAFVVASVTAMRRRRI